MDNVRERCAIEGCDRNARSRGLCDMHYHKVRNYGQLDLYAPSIRVAMSLSERLASRLVRVSSGCLEWTGSRLPAGYGHITVDGDPVYTHRLSWMLVNGPIPEGMFICHKCDNPPCVAIEHLFLGTPGDNAADRAAKGRNGNARRS